MDFRIGILKGTLRTQKTQLCADLWVVLEEGVILIPPLSSTTIYALMTTFSPSSVGHLFNHMLKAEMCKTEVIIAGKLQTF